MAARRLSRALYMRGAHSPQFSRISLWCRDLHLGTCIGKRNGEEQERARGRAACKGRWWGVLRLPRDQAAMARHE